MPESRAEQARRVANVLHDLYPEADCALNHSNAHELLFATIMSAQTTDVNVNRVTETLFREYPTVQAFADADLETFQEQIRSTGFFRNKARNVIGAANMLVDEFDGQVPDTMEDLLKLPGVARKTANVVLGTWFSKPVGFVVDTHVKRLAFRLGLTEQTRPEKVEEDLTDAFDQKEWIFAGHGLILHGRAICDARKPECERCPMEAFCPKYGVSERAS